MKFANIIIAATSAAGNAIKGEIKKQINDARIPNGQLPVNLKAIQHCQEDMYTKPDLSKFEKATAVVYTTDKGLKIGERRYLRHSICHGGLTMSEAAAEVARNIVRGGCQYKGRVFYVTRTSFEEIPTKLINQYMVEFLQDKAKAINLDMEIIDGMTIRMKDGQQLDLNCLM